MSHTADAIYADTGHGGGFSFFDVSAMVADANTTITRSAGPPILYYLHIPSTDTSHILIGLSGLKRVQEYPSNYPKTDAMGVSVQPHQERFGNAAGNPGWVEQHPGYPPYTGATQLVPATGDPLKGLRPISLTVFYAVNTVDASAGTVGVYRNTYANGAAITQATLLAATNLTLTHATNPYAFTTSLTTSVFESTDLTDAFVELTLTAGAGGTIDVYGVEVRFHLNYN